MIIHASNPNGAIFANNLESFALGGEVALNLGKRWEYLMPLPLHYLEKSSTKGIVIVEDYF